MILLADTDQADVDERDIKQFRSRAGATPVLRPRPPHPLCFNRSPQPESTWPWSLPKPPGGGPPPPPHPCAAPTRGRRRSLARAVHTMMQSVKALDLALSYAHARGATAGPACWPRRFAAEPRPICSRAGRAVRRPRARAGRFETLVEPATSRSPPTFEASTRSSDVAHLRGWHRRCASRLRNRRVRRSHPAVARRHEQTKKEMKPSWRYQQPRQFRQGWMD